MKVLGVVAATVLGLGSLGLGAAYWFGILAYSALAEGFTDIDMTGIVTTTDYLLATLFTIVGVALLVAAGALGSMSLRARRMA